jgi:hypothetical protein
MVSKVVETMKFTRENVIIYRTNLLSYVPGLKADAMRYPVLPFTNTEAADALVRRAVTNANPFCEEP